MKKHLALILIISLSCSTKKENDKNIYGTRISILNDYFGKSEQFPIYFYYTDASNFKYNRTLIDSTDNKQVIIKDLSIIANKKVYDITKINNMLVANGNNLNKVWVTQKMEIVFLR